MSTRNVTERSVIAHEIKTIRQICSRLQLTPSQELHDNLGDILRIAKEMRDKGFKDNNGEPYTSAIVKRRIKTFLEASEKERDEYSPYREVNTASASEVAAHLSQPASPSSNANSTPVNSMAVSSFFSGIVELKDKIEKLSMLRSHDVEGKKFCEGIYRKCVVYLDQKSLYESGLKQVTSGQFTWLDKTTVTTEHWLQKCAEEPELTC